MDRINLESRSESTIADALYGMTINLLPIDCG